MNDFLTTEAAEGAEEEKREFSTDLVGSEILHHSQLAFYEQAVRPVPQRLYFLVEQAGQPVADNGAKSQFDRMCVRSPILEYLVVSSSRTRED